MAQLPAETQKHLPFEGAHALIVEDNPYALDIMSIYLKRQGISSDGAENGKEGLEKYLSGPEKYQIVFMDLQMPLVNGYEATRKIRESGCPGAAELPIVAMSGDPLGNLFELGFSKQLKKPFAMEDVFSILTSFLAP